MTAPDTTPGTDDVLEPTEHPHPDSHGQASPHDDDEPARRTQHEREQVAQDRD